MRAADGETLTRGGHVAWWRCGFGMTRSRGSSTPSVPVTPPFPSCSSAGAVLRHALKRHLHGRAAQVATFKHRDRVDKRLSRVVYAWRMHVARSTHRLGPYERGPRALGTIRRRYGHRTSLCSGLPSRGNRHKHVG